MSDLRYSADAGVPGLVLRGSGDPLDVTRAITAGTFVRPVSGAISLDLTLRDADPRRPILNAPLLTAPFYAELYGLRFTGTGIDKRGHDVQLQFVDGIAVALSKRRGLLTIPAGTQTRAQIVKRLCDEIPVEVVVDPAERGVVNTVVERKDDVSSWDLLGTLADDVGWRRLSDGRRVYVGSDAWLASLSAPIEFREFTGAVHGIDFRVNVAEPANSCSLDVDAELWAVSAGRPFTIAGLGLASGDWLVEEFRRDVFRTRATVTGTRRQLVIPEPPPEQTETPGESGESDFVPDAESLSTPAPGRYGGSTFTGEQIGNAVGIARVALQRNTGKRGAVAALMCACQESSLRNLAGGDRDSVGLFQQRPSQGWGTVAQCRNLEYATGKFLAELTKIGGWQSGDLGALIQRVQRSAHPGAYSKWSDEADALYAAIVKSASAAAATAGTATVTGGAGLDRVADEAVKLAGRVTVYRYGGKTLAGLDCSGFVAMATRNAGRELAGGSKQQIAAAQKAGKGCSVAEGLRTRGAILFRGSTDPTHIAFSLGDGRTAEARGTQQGVGIFTGAAARTWTAAAKWSP